MFTFELIFYNLLPLKRSHKKFGVFEFNFLMAPYLTYSTLW